MASKSNSSVTVSLNNTNKSVDLPVLSGTLGPDVIDIRSLYSSTNMFTFDPGYGATGSCMSGLTFIDGDEGVLLHRGYPIEQLAEKSTFLEVAYLLLNGELPNTEQNDEFTHGCQEKVKKCLRNIFSIVTNLVVISVSTPHLECLWYSR